ncbi:MAG: hypothetical protein WDN76_06415 [Alphaproteobacteria bacterium]
MRQIVVIHSLRATKVAADFVRRLQAEGFIVPWDPEYGGLIAIGALEPEAAPCTLVLWTKDAPTSRWVRDYAAAASTRNALVEVMIEPVLSPVGNAVEPLDFSDVADEKAEARLWKELISRVEAKTGQPNGRLPLRKEIRPLAVFGGFGFAVIATMATMPGLQPNSDGLITRQTALIPASELPTATGGPMVSPVDLVPHKTAPVKVTFAPLSAGPSAVIRVRVVEDTTLASDDNAVVYRLVDLATPTAS